MNDWMDNEFNYSFKHALFLPPLAIRPLLMIVSLVNWWVKKAFCPAVRPNMEWNLPSKFIHRRDTAQDTERWHHTPWVIFLAGDHQQCFLLYLNVLWAYFFPLSLGKLRWNLNYSISKSLTIKHAVVPNLRPFWSLRNHLVKMIKIVYKKPRLLSPIWWIKGE